MDIFKVLLVGFYRKIRLIVFLLICCASIMYGAVPGAYTDFRFKTVSTESGLSQSSVLSIIQDNYGFIWMGTKYGLNRYDGYRFSNYTYDVTDTNSLRPNEIIYLFIDDNGDLLIGSRGGGLFRFIYSKNIFTQIKDIPNNATINSIKRDKDSSLWICTDQGLFRGVKIKDKQQYNYLLTSKNATYRGIEGKEIEAIQSRKAIFSILQLSKNKYLTGTDNGLFYYYPQQNTFRRVDFYTFENGKVNALLQVNRNIYIASSEGLTVVDSTNQEQAKIYNYDIQQPEERRLKVNWINRIVADENGNIWGGTRGGGLFKIDTLGRIKTFTSRPNGIASVSDNHINWLFIDNKDVLWLGTESRGCNTLDLNRKKFHLLEQDEPGGMSELKYQITAVTGNRKNTTYFGTAFNGILKVQGNAVKGYKTEFIDDLKGLNPYNSNEVISLLYDKSDDLWIGMAMNGIVRLEKNQKPKSYETGGFVFAIHEDRNGNIWYGTWGNGFGSIDKKNNTCIQYNHAFNKQASPQSDLVIAINDDNEGNLWLGTKGGGLYISPIVLLNHNKNSFAHYAAGAADSVGLSNNNITCISIASDSAVWVGTEQGLNKVVFTENTSHYEALLKGNVKFKVYTETQGLPNNAICGILEDASGNLWISSLGGISMLNPKTDEIINYSKDDGLQANEFHSNAFYQATNHEFYFGGINGITQFNPEAIKPNPHKPEIILTAFKVSNKKVLPDQKVNDKILLNDDIANTKKIVLTRKHKEFTFEFSGMHYANALSTKYEYRLKGFNENWRTIGKNEHSATYTNLFDGDYTFQVKAVNNEGLSSKHIAEIEIEILPPFWRRPVFYVLYFVLILGLLFVFRKYSLIAVNEKSKLKIEALERRKMAELAESKMRFFTNMSHEIRTPLTLIYSPIEKVLAKGRIDNESRTNLTLVKKNVSRLLNITNHLLQLRKVDIGVLEPGYENVNCTSYFQEILDYFKNTSKRKAITLKLDSSTISEDSSIWLDKEMITTALYNLLSNSFKYTRQGGSIYVTLEIKSENSDVQEKTQEIKAIDRWLQIEIKDSGAGIPKEEVEKIFQRFYQVGNSAHTEYAGSGIGLSIVKEYIELHRGTIKAESQFNAGTTMTIHLPMGNAHVSDKNIKQSKTTSLRSKVLIDTLTDIEASAEAANKEHAASDADSKKIAILIVDDDPDMLAYLKRQFEESYTVYIAPNGKEALAVVAKNDLNLIISDLMMPELNGLEFCKKVKENIESSHIPFILLTAKAEDEHIIEGYESRADRYITKPFSTEILQAQVEQLLETRRQLIDLYSKKVLLKPKDVDITSMDETFLSKLVDLIDENIADAQFDVSKMVDKMNMSHSALLKKVKGLTSYSLVEFVRRYRLNKAAMIFEKERLPINEVAFMVGFSDAKYFSKCFNKQFGKTPTEYAKSFES